MFVKRQMAQTVGGVPKLRLDDEHEFFRRGVGEGKSDGERKADEVLAKL